MQFWYLEPCSSPDKRIALEGDRLSVGRSDDCGITLSARQISRQHALIFLDDGVPVLRDMNSTNGTFINGESFEGEEELEHDDIISFGNQEFRVVSSARQQRAASRRNAAYLQR